VRPAEYSYVRHGEAVSLSPIRVELRAELAGYDWWFIDWMLYRWALKAARPKGLPTLRVSM
jgi:hypothetical protein